MMMNMFSMFDSNIMSMPLNIILTTMMILMMTKNNNMKINNKLMMKFKNMMNKEMMKNKNNKTLLSLFVPTSFMLMVMNMMNLMPNIMSPSSMMTFNLAMTMSMWTNTMMMNMKNYKTLLMNLSPKNTPMSMMWTINLIELNSLIFQILSLTMRLSINMMLGHIIMKLMNNIAAMMLYTMIELMIIMIQSYIFVTLNMLNFNNTN